MVTALSGAKIDGSFLLDYISWDRTAYPLTITRTGGVWGSDFNRNRYLPDSLFGTTYWVDNVSGSNNNNGSQASPFRAIWKAVDAANTLGAPAAVMIKAGNYGRSLSFNNAGAVVNNSQKMAFFGYGGSVTTGPFVGTNETLTFSADIVYTNTYSTSRSNTVQIYDLLNNGVDGLPNQLAYVTTPLICNTTPGSWTLSGSTLYIRRADGAQPVVEVNTRVQLAHTNWVRGTGCEDVYVQGIDFFGSNGSAAMSIDGLTGKANIFQSCGFLTAGTPITPNLNDGASTDNSTGLVAYLNCRSIGNAKDGFNTHGDPTNRGIYTLTQNCTTRYNGEFGSTSNNGITAHEKAVWVDINGDYQHDSGGEARYINDSRLAAYGTLTGYDIPSDLAYGVGYRTSDTAQMWLWDCAAQMTNPTTDYSIQTPGGAIAVRNFINRGGLISGATAF